MVQKKKKTWKRREAAHVREKERKRKENQTTKSKVSPDITINPIFSHDLFVFLIFIQQVHLLHLFHHKKQRESTSGLLNLAIKEEQPTSQRAESKNDKAIWEQQQKSNLYK